MPKNLDNPDFPPDASRGNQRYGAFLLRCWQEGNTWRYSLEIIKDNRRQGFETLSSLLSALQTELDRLTNLTDGDDE